MIEPSEGKDCEEKAAAQIRSEIGMMSTAWALGKFLIQEAVQLLEKVGLQEQMYQRANALSGGQMQRVGICRAIMQQPEGNQSLLDPNAAKVVMKQLQETRACQFASS